jgi:hypothetical protein
MPRNVRNFFAHLQVDGRSPINTGPQALNGGMSIHLTQRHRGSVEHVVTIDSSAHGDVLVTRIRIFNGTEIEIRTVRDGDGDREIENELMQVNVSP